MIRRLWVAGWALVITAAVAVIPLTLTAIWGGSSKFADTAGMAGVIAFLGGLLMAVITGCVTEGAPERNLPRRVRKQLRVEQDRIRLQRAIEDAEREAGLR